MKALLEELHLMLVLSCVLILQHRETLNMEQFLQMVLSFFFSFSEKYPFIASVMVIMASARMIIKPVISALKVYAAESESKKDDELVAKVEGNQVYKAIMYVLDYVFSIKKI